MEDTCRHGKPKKQNCHNESYDYIIVGAGMSGSSLAGFVSADRTASVLLLEAGENRDNDPDILVTQPRSQVLGIAGDPKFSWPQQVALPSPAIYHETPDVDTGKGPGMNGNGEAARYGRGLGGSSLHFHFFYVRGDYKIWNQWAEKSGNVKWSYDNMVHLMEAVENYRPNGTSLNSDRGQNKGGLVATQVVAPEVIKAYPVAKAMEALGTPYIEDYNTKDGVIGYSSNQQFVSNPTADAERVFTSKYFLNDKVVNMQGTEGKGVNGRRLTVYTEAIVTRVLFEVKGHGKCKKVKAVGVEVSRKLDGVLKCEKFYANKKVILSAGPIQNPAILQRSGVGPKSVLQDQGFDIPIIVQNEHVGRHLQNHNGVLVGINTNVSDGDYKFIGTQFESTSQSLNVKNNPSFINKGHDFRMHAFIDNTGVGKDLLPPSAYDEGVRYIQVFSNHGPSLRSRLVSQNPDLYRLTKLPGNQIQTLQFETMLPKTEGVVFVCDRDPHNFPRVDFNYYGDWIASEHNGVQAWDQPGTDAYTSVASFKMVKRLCEKMGTTLAFPPPEAFNPLIADDGVTVLASANERLFRCAQDSGTPGHHYIRTTRMAKWAGHDQTDDGGVVNGNLHVFGVKNLMCVCNSIIPVMITGNTAMAAVYIAAFAAENVLGHNVAAAIADAPYVSEKFQ